jgi:hypothetical protein
MHGRFGELAPDLIDVFLVALLDLFAKQLAQRSFAQPLVTTLGEIGDEIGNQGTRQPARLGVWIVREERVDGRARRRYRTSRRMPRWRARWRRWSRDSGGPSDRGRRGAKRPHRGRTGKWRRLPSWRRDSRCWRLGWNGWNGWKRGASAGNPAAWWRRASRSCDSRRRGGLTRRENPWTGGRTDRRRR